MTRSFAALALLASLGLVACSHATDVRSPDGRPGSAARSSHGGYAPVAGEAAPSPAAAADGDHGYAAPEAAAQAGRAAAPSAKSGAYEAEVEERASRDEDRPGLGTSWGEAVSSRVTSTAFTRAGDSPWATVAISYNDEAGVAAMTRGRYVDWTDGVVSALGGRVTVSVVDGSGAPLRAARVDGRVIAVGNDGDRYMVRVENRTPARIETVATVDGLDVVDGDEGSFGKRGYVVGPFDTLEIEGFRESEGSVRAFRFGSVSDSYAGRRGKDRNVGVIGVAVFRERDADYRWTPDEVQRRETADPFPARFAPAPPPVQRRAW